MRNFAGFSEKFLNGHARFVFRSLKHRYMKEKIEINCVLEHLSPGDVAVDIGAYKGVYAYWMARAVGKNGKVFVFEPQALLAEYLRKIFSMPCYSMVTVEEKALSSGVGTDYIVVPESKKRYSQMAKLGSADEQGAHAGFSYKVAVDTLDNYFSARRTGPIRFIKCDVEGHELEVFRGACNILRTDYPVILFECEARHFSGQSTAEVFGFLEEIGYEGRFISGSRMYPVREFDEKLHQSGISGKYINNFLFVKKRR